MSKLFVRRARWGSGGEKSDQPSVDPIWVGDVAGVATLEEQVEFGIGERLGQGEGAETGTNMSSLEAMTQAGWWMAWM